LTLEERPVLTKRRVVAAVSGIAALVAVLAAGQLWRAHGAADHQVGRPVQQIHSGDLTVVLLSPTGTLHQGRNTFTIEFRRANGSPVDVGVARMNANMAMPGMAMSGGAEVSRTS